jgi:hypothetical protein
MGEFNPLGSEKLANQDKLKRILELTYYGNINEVEKKYSYEYITEGNGCVYGIVKEKDDYYVKKGLNETTLDYIGGMFMKNKNRFSSYAEALKRLELVKSQEMLNESTKYVLKTNKPEQPKAESPLPPAPAAPEPAPQEQSPENSGSSASDIDSMLNDTGDSENTPETPEFNDEMGPESEEDTTIKSIQKLTGKLGQKIREFSEEIKSEDIKYVLNSVISAFDLEKLEDADKEDILSKLEDEEDDDEFSSENNQDMENMGGDDAEDLEMSEMEDLINSEFDFDDNDAQFDDNDNDVQFDEDVKSILNRYKSSKVKKYKTLPLDDVDDDYWFK